MRVTAAAQAEEFRKEMEGLKAEEAKLNAALRGVIDDRAKLEAEALAVGDAEQRAFSSLFKERLRRWGERRMRAALVAWGARVQREQRLRWLAAASESRTVSRRLTWALRTWRSRAAHRATGRRKVRHCRTGRLRRTARRVVWAWQRRVWLRALARRCSDRAASVGER